MQEELRVTKNIREAKERRDRGESPWKDKILELGDLNNKKPLKDLKNDDSNKRS